jgi:GNAT superfamily N-acetyltransferase
MVKVEIVPAVPADFQDVFETAPKIRTRSVTAKIAGRVVGVGGVGYVKDGSVVAFAFITDELRKNKIALHKAGLKVIADAKRDGIKRLIAQASADVPAAVRWLERYGFKPVGKVYVLELGGAS